MSRIIHVDKNKILKSFAKRKGWIDVINPSKRTVFNVAKLYNLHPITTEDILSRQRTKIEEFENYVFIVFAWLNYDGGKIKREQLSLIISKDTVITFQASNDNLATVKKKAGETGYVVYSVIDSVVDNYFKVLEKTGEELERLENQILNGSENKVLHKIQAMKHDLLIMRRYIWPLREVINALLRADNKLFSKKIRVYLKDIYDHTVQVIDTIETYREMLSGLIEIHLSTLSNRMNEIIKVLTIISTIFIPLTFVTGIYGMNFKNMPELSWQWGYFSILGVMLTVGLVMVFYMRRRKWL